MKKIIVLLTVLAASLAFAVPADAQCKVQKNESLWSIAKEYHLDFAELLKLNKHLPDVHLIHPNQHVHTQNDTGTSEDATPHHDNQGNGNDQNSTTQSEQHESSEQAQLILDLVNAERAKAGAGALQLDQKLNEVATVKAKDMATSRYFSHDSPTYGTPFEMMHSFGIEYRAAAENIAAGQRSAAEVMDSWMHSSGHKANILNKEYTHIGIGYYVNDAGTPYWVQQFIKR